MRSFVLLPLILLQILPHKDVSAQTVHSGSLRLGLDAGTGVYSVGFDSLGWNFLGELHTTATGVQVRSGTDRIGPYKEIAFQWSSGRAMRGSIRAYARRNAVLFSESVIGKSGINPPPFPVLHASPSGAYLLTYAEREFAAPQIFRRLGEKSGVTDTVHSGPVVLFENASKACILSAASDFMVSCIVEHSDGSIASSLLPGLTDVGKEYTYKTLLVGAPGINRAWETWGTLLTDLHGKKRPSNEADTGLRYLGYWTDNGASYYYNYDTTKGYEGTLLSEVRHLDTVGIPVRYLQLDSWWYLKGFNPPDGKVPEHPESKNAALPAGEWNRYGGLLEYSPARALFPDGLKSFRKKVGIPLITHNRWIERDSPYRKKYTISGIGAIDPRWWEMIASNIASWGVQTYEQDWQNFIYQYSPEFTSTTWAAEKFFDGMAEACARHGLTMQYCMSLPRCYLQGGANYPNLTTMRVSGDRFERSKWKEFLYGSRFSSALGVWPWADVFMSTEKDNLLLATLSAGMVGIGDAYGTENPANIALAVRPDGVIVKPDASIVPTDQTVLADAASVPTARTGFTFTSTPGEQSGARVVYLFSYNDGERVAAVPTRPCDLGMSGRVFVYDFFAQKGMPLRSTDSLSAVDAGGEQYLVIAPVDGNGIALVGDPGKFATRGRERISAIVPVSHGIEVSVLLAKSEQGMSLVGYAKSKPEVSAKDGSVEVTKYDERSGQFLLTLRCAHGAKMQKEHGDAVMKVKVAIRSRI